MIWEGLTPPYSTIVVDPPWDYGEGFAAGPGHGTWTTEPLPYSSMSVDEIEALPVADLAASASRLFLWTTNRYLPASLGIIKAWGFRYRQLITWHKIDTNLGGSVAPTSAEFLVVAVKGSPPVTGRWHTSVIQAVHGRTHSEKPAAFGDLVEAVSPPPYVELFARQPRLGWDAWGHGYEMSTHDTAPSRELGAAERGAGTPQKAG